MAVKAYEDACMRAELFGQPKPDRDDFLSKHKHLDVVEFEEIDIKTTENTAMLSDDLKNASGGLTELNTILNSTQTKLNRLRGVCGTVTNFFRIKLISKDNLSYSSEPSYIGQTNYDKDYVPSKNSEIGFINTGLGPNDNEMTPRAAKPEQIGGDINSALADLEAMEIVENTSLLRKPVAIDHRKQISNQVSKLDNMILQAERAEESLKRQNRQIRSFIR